jgi:hypothetical protein
LEQHTGSPAHTSAFNVRLCRNRTLKFEGDPGGGVAFPFFPRRTIRLMH